MSGDIFKRIPYTKRIFKTMGVFLSSVKLVLPHVMIKRPIPDGPYDVKTGKLLPQKLDGDLYPISEDPYNYQNGYNEPLEITKYPTPGTNYVAGDYTYTFNGEHWINEPLRPNQSPDDPGMYAVGVVGLSSENTIAGLRTDGAFVWNPSRKGDDLDTNKLDGGEF